MRKIWVFGLAASTIGLGCGSITFGPVPEQPAPDDAGDIGVPIMDVDIGMMDGGPPPPPPPPNTECQDVELPEFPSSWPFADYRAVFFNWASEQATPSCNLGPCHGHDGSRSLMLIPDAAAQSSRFEAARSQLWERIQETEPATGSTPPTARLWAHHPGHPDPEPPLYSPESIQFLNDLFTQAQSCALEPIYSNPPDSGVPCTSTSSSADAGVLCYCPLPQMEINATNCQ